MLALQCALFTEVSQLNNVEMHVHYGALDYRLTVL